MSWPSVELDGVRQLRVLAAVLPGVALVERIIPTSYGEFWTTMANLEDSVPRIEPLVRSLQVLTREGEKLTALVRSRFGVSLEFDIELRDGWCWMQSPAYLVGMAATAEGEATRYAHLEGVPYRWGALFKPLFRWLVEGDISRIARISKGP
jgi:hypothetical protein